MRITRRLLIFLALICSLNIIAVSPSSVKASHEAPIIASVSVSHAAHLFGTWSLTLAPASGVAGWGVTVIAPGFPINWPIYLYWNTSVVGVAVASWTGVLNVQLTIPAAPPGLYTVWAQPLGSTTRALGSFELLSGSVPPVAAPAPNSALWDSTAPTAMIPVAATTPITGAPVAQEPDEACAPSIEAQQGEHYLLNLLNHARALNGVPPLALSLGLSAVAWEHSCDLARHPVQSWNGWPHTGSDSSSTYSRMAAAGFGLPPYQQAGENIGWGQGYTAVQAAVDDATSQMLAEPPGEQNHRWNILNRDYKIVGIGIVVLNGWIWITEDFAG